MATARKRFFTVECSLYREPWPRELKLALVMLGMHMTDRWASDSLTPKQATVAHLAVGDLLTITGAETREEAHKVLRQLAALVTIKVTPLDNGFARVEWRKLAETQWSKSRYSGSKPGKVRARLSPKNAPSDSDPDPDPDSDSEEAEQEKKTEAPAGPGAVVGPLDDVGRELPSWGRLANLLGPHGAQPPPEVDERESWLASFWPEIVAATDAELPDTASDKQRNAARARIALARWRVYLRSDRAYRGIAARTALRASQEAFAAKMRARPDPAPRSAEEEAKFDRLFAEHGL